jgi:adhesin transport system outer membrane protein
MGVRMALDNNNSIKVAKSNVQIAETNHRETTSKLVPTITLELEGERDRNMSASTGFQNRLTAMVVARHNLFSGGADFAKSRETVKRMTEAHARLNLARRQTERTIRASWGEAKSSRAKSAHLTNLIREKRNIRDTYLEEFTLGKRTLIDLLDAANDVFITEATRTSVDATTDINTIVLSVGTTQFIRYLGNAGNNETEEEETKRQEPDTTTYSSDLQPSLYLTPYRTPSPAKLLKVKNSGFKKTALTRKSIFEKRKEERLTVLQAKSST